MSIDKARVCTELKVKNKIRETADAVSLVLDIPREHTVKFQYKAGQFVTFFLDLNGEELRRSYSIASAPKLDSDFKITIKLVPGGKASPYLVNVIKPGDVLWTTPPAGVFVLPEPLSATRIAFYAAGSGITPIISIMKSAVQQKPDLQATLFFQNRHEGSIIFKNELDDLNQKYGERLQVQHILSQPKTTSWAGHVGRINHRFLNEHLPTPFCSTDTLHMLCGPDEFMMSIISSLQTMSVDPQNILQESFSTSSTIAPESAEAYTLDEDSIIIGDRSTASSPETIEVVLEGKSQIVPYQKNRTILDCLLDAGLNPPYSCMNGSCMACIAKVERGVVFQNDMGILSDDNVEAKDCLTCQAYPASKIVKINYDPM